MPFYDVINIKDDRGTAGQEGQNLGLHGVWKDPIISNLSVVFKEVQDDREIRQLAGNGRQIGPGFPAALDEP